MSPGRRAGRVVTLHSGARLGTLLNLAPQQPYVLSLWRERPQRCGLAALLDDDRVAREFHVYQGRREVLLARTLDLFLRRRVRREVEREVSALRDALDRHFT